MNSTELMKKIDELVADTNVYGYKIFTNWVAKEVVEAIELKEDSIPIEQLLLIFNLAKTFSKDMEDREKLEEKELSKAKQKWRK